MAIVATLWRHYNHRRSVERVREVDFLQILKVTWHWILQLPNCFEDFKKTALYTVVQLHK